MKGAPSWLARQKVTVPDPPAGHFARPELMSRILPTQGAVTVLRAPAGFGKTTLLADYCRSLNSESIPTAWLSVEEHDGPETLHTCLAHAFGQAGVPVDRGLADDGAAESPVQRSRQLVSAIASHATPCVLALDQLERMTDAHCVGIVNSLLEYRPPNLRLAFACREFPTGLDVAPSVLEGQALVLTANELRFSRAEIARFLGDSLTQRELDALHAESAGWPVAVRVDWHERRSGTATAGSSSRSYGLHWLESRMWRAMPSADRDLVLDAAIIDPLDPELLDEALDGSDLWQRLQGLPALDGLLVPVPDNAGGAPQLHPLLREHCEERRRRETPDRFRRIHRRLAQALARRGAIVDAMRHATAAEDPDLVATILEQAGGVHVWSRDGVVPLAGADRFLTPTLLEKNPRLALAHCGLLITAGRLDEAGRMYADVAARTGNFRQSDPQPDARELALDALHVRGLGALYGAAEMRSQEFQEVIRGYRKIVDAPAEGTSHGPMETPEIDPVIRGACEYGLLLYHSMRAEFSAARDRAARSWTALGGDWSYISVFVHYQRGVIAMAEGRVSAAAAWYARGRHSADTRFAQDANALAIGDVLVNELAVERNHLPVPARADQVPSALPSAPFQVYAAGSGTAVDLVLARDGFDRALDFLGELIEQAYRAEVPATTRYLSALRAGTLAAAGRVGEAQRTWRVADLPREDADCVDLEVQTWREVEAIASARIRLLWAEESFEGARSLVHALAETARQRGLRRTLMRCLALSMAVESAAGDRRASERSLVQFLDLFAETDYARSMVREHVTTLPLLEDYLDGSPEPARAQAAETLVGHLRDAADRRRSPVPRLTARETDILQRLEDLRDKEIAAALGISHAGVRYHVRNIFAKLNARSRLDAVHRARRMGVLSG